ncbi:hypothetical protein [Escherichia coli]|uniref:hypothetical protein n=1 Tax=Escherichia coli TaxID=562 RepID=UPI0004D40FC0|nr:hypothetical protein [Escherichia coli]KDW32719.1 hypothetical protein AC15_1533 [Escherichia coli 2-156-04_S3_C2]
MTKKTPFAIGAMFHRFRGDIQPFEVTTFSSYYDFGTEYYAGSKVGGESYTLMANTWRFIRFSEKDDDGMNKESEIIDELIEDERHDCDKTEVTEWKPGEKPPCGVWLDCYYPDGYHIGILMFKFIGDKYGVYTEKGSIQKENAIEWGLYNYYLYVDPKEKALAQIAFALATKVIGEDAAGEIDFNHDNDYSRDYRNMAQAIIDGCIGHVEYTGDK